MTSSYLRKRSKKTRILKTSKRKNKEKKEDLVRRPVFFVFLASGQGLDARKEVSLARMEIYPLRIEHIGDQGRANHPLFEGWSRSNLQPYCSTKTQEIKPFRFLFPGYLPEKGRDNRRSTKYFCIPVFMDNLHSSRIMI